MRSLTAILIAVLVAVGVLPAVADAEPTPQVSGSPSPSPSAQPSPAVYPVFNYPSTGVPDPSINGEAARLVAEVPAGEVISAALFVVTPTHPLIDALLAAYARGADVRIVLDSGNGQGVATDKAVDDTFVRLAAAMGTDTAARSFVVQCATACISAEPDSINHNKFVIMSGTTSLTDVVFQSTANVRSDGSGDGAWNAATVSSGNPELYASYQGYFLDLAAGLTVPDGDYNASRPPAPAGRWTPYYFPRTDGTDSVATTLEGVDCRVTPTRIDVMAAFFTRPKIRNRLNDMAAAGCAVRVIARTDTITREFCQSLLPPIDVRLSDRPSPTAVGIHGKYLTISGGFEGEDRDLVWMGSQNFTRNALVRNDETFLLIEDADLRARFTENFDRIWGTPSLTAGCDRAGGISPEAIEEEANQEVTVLIKAPQTVSRALPKTLRTKRTALKSTRTLQGQPLTTLILCRVRGSDQKLRPRRICDLTRPRSAPTVVLTPPRKKRLRVRIVQEAPGTAALEPFRRQAGYTYRR